MCEPVQESDKSVEFQYPEVVTTSEYLDMSRELFAYLALNGRAVDENQLYSLTKNYPYLQLMKPQLLRSLVEKMDSGTGLETELGNFSMDQVEDVDLANMFVYAIDRLPRELIDFDCEVVFDCNYFPQRNVVRRIPSKRNRGYFVDDLEEGGKRIVFEIRTMTDLYENVSLLAAFSSLRHRIREIINLGNEEDSSLRIMHIGNSLNGSKTGKSGNLDLRDFAYKGFTMKGAFGVVPALEDYLTSGTNSSIHASELVAAGLRELSPEDLARQHIIFFGNSFMYINSMAHSLLNYPANDGTDGEADNTLADYLITNLVNSSDLELRAIEKVRQLIELNDTDYHSEYLKRLGLRSFLVACLQDQGLVGTILDRLPNIPSDFKQRIETFNQTINSAEFRESIGLKTLVRADDSPTSEPLFYINPDQIEDKVLNALDKYTRQALIEIRDQGLRIFMLPYALGELTGFIMKSFVESCPLAGVVELGKIGSLVSKVERVVGRTVSVQLIHDKSSEVEHHRTHDYRQWTINVQAPTVLTQSVDDFCNWYEVFRSFIDSDGRGSSRNMGWRNRVRHLTVGMEHTTISRVANTFGLPVFFSDYISDVVVGPERISQGLGIRGVISGQEAFLNCLESIPRLERERRKPNIVYYPIPRT